MANTINREGTTDAPPPKATDKACGCPRKGNGIHLASCPKYYPFGTPRRAGAGVARGAR
jgi:hypothetical protein